MGQSGMDATFSGAIPGNLPHLSRRAGLRPRGQLGANTRITAHRDRPPLASEVREAEGCGMCDT
eukprot:5824076-Prymnesium_polylepis.1